MNDNKRDQERTELYRTIWALANELRGSVDGWDFKQYVLGMLFYRYISENLTTYLNKGEWEAGNTDFDYAQISDEEALSVKDDMVQEKGFFIKPSELFGNLLNRIKKADKAAKDEAERNGNEIGVADLDENLNVVLQENFKNLEHLNLKLRAQRHEYLNEMQVVYGLLELEEYEEAYRYLHPLYEDIARIGKALRTKKPAVNALLQAKMEYAQKQQITFFVEVSSDLAALSMEQWEVCRILGNLIDNAFTAVSGMDGEKKVHLCIQENEKQYLFIVYNNGPVIPENKRELIFKKGYSSKKEEGHGLGLWMVRKLAGQYRGTITVTSVPGKTEFDVTLPK